MTSARKLGSRFLFLGILAGMIFTGGAKRASAAALYLDVEPIVGYERVQKLVPTRHQTNRMYYGGRLSFGFLLIALEAEYNRATDEEVFTIPSMTVKDTDDRLKLGLKSTLRLSTFIRFIARGGVQARQNVHEEITDGVSSGAVRSAIEYKPYGGAGLRIGLSYRLAFTASVTVVFNNFPKMAENNYETSAGFTLRLP